MNIFALQRKHLTKTWSIFRLMEDACWYRSIDYTLSWLYRQLDLTRPPVVSANIAVLPSFCLGSSQSQVARIPLWQFCCLAWCLLLSIQWVIAKRWTSCNSWLRSFLCINLSQGRTRFPYLSTFSDLLFHCCELPSRYKSYKMTQQRLI